jgi:hypothetical protein
MTSQKLSADLVVVGGGLAGVCAAIAAARNGAKTILIQDRSVLGGNSSSEVKMHVVGADCHGTRPGARESGLIEELKLEDAARNPHRSYAQWDLLLYEKVIEEPNITLMLDTDCDGCVIDTQAGGRRIEAVKATRNSTEEHFTISAPYFADCSGDGRLGFEAGAEFTVGREGKADFNESLAAEESDRFTLGSSILFTARRYETPQPFVAPLWARRFTPNDFKHRPIPSYEYGYWWFEWGGHLDTLKDNPRIRHELLRIALGIWNYIKNSGDHPDSAYWALDWVGAIPGKRESRRFLGPHVLTEQDVRSGRIFADQVAYGGWWLDLHPPRGIDAVDERPCEQHRFPHLYTIPLRCLYSRNVDNLFLCGRIISATHVAFASTRVMGTCAVIGQAVGTAVAVACQAALSNGGGVSVDRRSASGIAAMFSGELLPQLQQRLLKDDAFLPGLSNSDPADRARRAAISASSNWRESDAARVVDGITRELPSALGEWADGGSHRWQSSALPAWIELAWDTPQPVKEIHLTFDSGFQRELILSASDAATQKTVRGPQPELVRDYDLTVDGRVILSITGNYVRKRIHRLAEPVNARRLHVVVKSTHGVPEARIFEIRVY